MISVCLLRYIHICTYIPTEYRPITIIASYHFHLQPLLWCIFFIIFYFATHLQQILLSVQHNAVITIVCTYQEIDYSAARADLSSVNSWNKFTQISSAGLLTSPGIVKASYLQLINKSNVFKMCLWKCPLTIVPDIPKQFVKKWKICSIPNIALPS